MLVVHGGLAIDIPEGWADQSTLLFTAPVDDVALPTAHRAAKTTESLAVTFGHADSDDANAIVLDEVNQLRKADPELVLVDVTPMSCGLGDGRVASVRLTLSGITVHQLTAVVLVGPVAVRATVSCVEAAFARREPALRALLQSIGFAPSPKAGP